MKNFLRALRYCWPYRRRLLASIFCALLAALLWGMNFTAIYPVLKILGGEQNLQEWAGSRIEDAQKRIDGGPDPEKGLPGLQAEVDALNRENKDLDNVPAGEWKEHEAREVSMRLAKAESKLQAARSELYHFQVLKKYLDQYLPTDRFQTLLWL